MKQARTRKQWLELAMAILGWAVLVVFAVVFLAYAVQYARISMSPQNALGVVQEKTAKEDRGEDLADRWEVRYSFNAASGLDYQGRAGVSRSFYYSVEVGDPLEVEYATDDPGNSRLRGKLDPDIVMVFVLIALNACLFGYVGVREVVRRLARHARARPIS